MDYIINSKCEGIDFTSYSNYLTSIRDQLPLHVYSFASDIKHFDLTSYSSLHDAWVEHLTIKENASGERNENRRLEIHICLLGPYHDRRIHLRYRGVSMYRFDTPSRYGELRYEHTAHGDLYTHEIRLGQNGFIIHELLFERDATFLIECADIQHSEEMIHPT